MRGAGRGRGDGSGRAGRSDSGDQRSRRPAQGIILQYVAATGAPIGAGVLIAAGSGRLNAPTALNVRPDGNLYVSESRTRAKVAAESGITPNAVRLAKSHVLRRLREELGELIA